MAFSRYNYFSFRFYYFRTSYIQTRFNCEFCYSRFPINHRFSIGWAIFVPRVEYFFLVPISRINPGHFWHYTYAISKIRFMSIKLKSKVSIFKTSSVVKNKLSLDSEYIPYTFLDFPRIEARANQLANTIEANQEKSRNVYGIYSESKLNLFFTTEEVLNIDTLDSN